MELFGIVSYAQKHKFCSSYIIFYRIFSIQISNIKPTKYNCHTKEKMHFILVPCQCQALQSFYEYQNERRLDILVVTRNERKIKKHRSRKKSIPQTEMYVSNQIPLAMRATDIPPDKRPTWIPKVLILDSFPYHIASYYPNFYRP